jgi:ParB-like nuclease domain
MRDRPNLDSDPSERLTISWERFRSIDYYVRAHGCEWITNESIIDCIHNDRLEDASSPQTAETHHAARVAWLATRISCGAKLDPIHIHINHNKAYVFNGSHRLRAYQFLSRDHRVPAIVTGRLEVLDLYRKNRQGPEEDRA